MTVENAKIRRWSKMKGPLYLHATKYPALNADIKERRLKDGRVRISGTAICAEDQSVFADIVPYEAKPVSLKRKNSAITEVITMLEVRYCETHMRKTLTEKDICIAFAAVSAKVEDGIRLKPTWRASSTNKQVIQFFGRNTLALVVPYLTSGRMFLDEDQKTVLEKMTEICSRHGSADRVAAQENAVKRLEEAELVLSHMRDCDALIPELSLAPAGFTNRAYRKEQIKMLPLPVLLAFFAALCCLIQRFPKEVFFAVLVSYGLRPAEAAGVKPVNLIWFSTYCVVPVQYQEVNGKLSDHLKNKYSARLVTISSWGMSILRECCALIGEDYPKDDRAMNSSPACAEWVKALLIENGATEAQLIYISDDLTEDDLDDSSIDRKNPGKAKEDRTAKIGCYVLRRCFTTIGRVHMGFSLYEIDRLLGHIPSGSGKNTARKLTNPDLNSPETQARIAAKMERFVFDPALSLNPALVPYTTEKREAVPIRVPYAEIRVENNEDCEIELELELTCSEPGEVLTFIYENGNVSEVSAFSTPVCFEDISRTVFCDMRKSVDHKPKEG